MIDGHGYAELIATKPFLYHRIWDADADKLNSVLEHGLERIASGYSGYWESRPGHVYMGDCECVLKINPHDGHKNADERSWVLLSIDTDLLEPRRLNPDEDHFMTHNFLDNGRGGRVCSRFGIPFAPSKWIWEWARYLSIPFPSLGEWADQIDLGSNPEQTRFSLSQGTVAYDGVVPPQALKVVQLHGIEESMA